MQESDFYSKFFSSLEQRISDITYNSTFRAITDYFEQHHQHPIPGQSDEDTDDLTDVKGIADYTHYSIPTIYSYVQQRKIPFYRQQNSRRILFSKKDVLAWIKNNRSDTIEEISDKARSIKLNTYNK